MLTAIFRSCGCGARQKPTPTSTSALPDEASNETTRLLADTASPKSSLHHSPPSSLLNNAANTANADLGSDGEDSGSTLERSLSTPSQAGSRASAAVSPEIRKDNEFEEAEPAAPVWQSTAEKAGTDGTARAAVAEAVVPGQAPENRLEPASEGEEAEPQTETTLAAALDGTAAGDQAAPESPVAPVEVDIADEPDSASKVVEETADPVTSAPTQAEPETEPEQAAAATNAKKGKSGKGKGKKAGKKREGNGRYRPR